MRCRSLAEPILVFLACSVAAGAATACRYPRRPLPLLLAEAPAVFVGTVEVVTPDSVTFQVEHAIKGVVEGRRVIKYETPVNTCTIRFEPGARWLYAGDSQPTGSRWLERTGGVASAKDAIGGLTRENDALIGLPAAWQACSTDAQCHTVPYGCSTTAAAVTHLADARALAVKRGGDPASVECQRNTTAWRVPKALCIASRCGSWTLGGN